MLPLLSFLKKSRTWNGSDPFSNYSSLRLVGDLTLFAVYMRMADALILYFGIFLFSKHPTEASISVKPLDSTDNSVYTVY